VRDQSLEPRPRSRTIVRMHAQPGINERSHEPRPDGALMVRGIARTQVDRS
jgi:hypothetical protein